MPFHVVWRRVRGYWKKRIVRGAVALLVFAGVLFLQYRLANIPLPVDVEASNKFTIPPIMLGQEELVIEGLVIDPASHQLLYHEGKPTESVSVTFDQARLSEDTIRLYDIKQVTPPTPAQINYDTYVPENKRPKPKPTLKPKPSPTPEAKVIEACQTNVRVELANKEKPPAEIHFFQKDRGREFFRHLEMKASGAELVVQIVTLSPAENDSNDSADEAAVEDDQGATEEDETAPPACLKSLRLKSQTIGEANVKIPPDSSMVAIPATDSTFMFHFLPLPGNSPSWGGKDGFYEAFTLGPPVGAPVIQAHGVSIKAFDGSVVLSIRAADAKSPLRVNKLEVGEDQLKASISGRGFVTIRGEEITVDLLERIKKYPIIAALFLVANAGLIAWLARLIRSLFPSQR
ncbi:MAG: hypothetical protein QOJ02_627 [Acidobacteriota bacterium]|jgi:hypothetical protein|nr:hypothetical protein [Acidobacteriota bacterium]